MNKHGRETHHYLKIGKMLVSLDLCILNQDRDDSWFQDRHRQETVALLQEVITERIHEFYARKRSARSCRTRGDNEAKPKAEQPKMLQGNTVKIGYKFTKRPVTQRCLLMSNTVKIGYKFTKRPVTQRCLLMKSKFESVTLLPEKIHVYVCEYHPSTVLQTTSRLLHTVYKDSAPATVGISDYFQSASNLEMRRVTMATTSALKKRNKLRRIVSRQNNAKPANKESYSAECGGDIPEMKQTRDETDARLSPRGKVGAAEEAKDAGGEQDGIMKSKHSSASKISPRQIARGQKITTSARESDSATGPVDGGSDVSEPVKKRKRNEDWSRNLRNKVASVHTGLDLPDGEIREQVKRQRVGATGVASEKGSPRTMQNRVHVRGTDLRTKVHNLGVVAREEDAVIAVAERDALPDDAVAREEDAVAREEDADAREEDAVAREEDAVAREEDAVAREEDVVAREEDAVARENDTKIVDMVDVNGRIVDLCGEEIHSDGDTDCHDIPPDPESIGNLSPLHLRRLMRRNKRYLKHIFIGKRCCKRHSDYKQGGSTRANLTYEAWHGPYSEDQVECVMSELVKVYCADHNKYFDYISKVLLPEALIKICMDVLRISREDAQVVLEKTPLCGDSTLLGSRCKDGGINYSVAQY